MKRIVLFMVMVSMVCIASYAQKATEGTKVLVAYFSATGNTEKAAQQVASIVSGDLHKIQPEKNYTSTDLNWRDKSSRSSVEMDDPTSRPAIIDDLKNLTEYDTVYLGFPIWWNQAPRLINTFWRNTISRVKPLSHSPHRAVAISRTQRVNCGKPIRM